MTVFKTFFKILNKNKGIIILYTVILLTFGAFNMSNSESTMVFEASKPDIYIVNEDEEVGITKDLIRYIKENSDTPEIENTKEAIDDALFYEEVNMVVYIPKGYHKDFIEGKNPEITVKKSETYYASFAEMIVKRYIKIATVYQKSITDENQLIEKVNETISKETQTQITTKLDTTALGKATFYFNFASYSYLACLIYVISLILLTFNEEKVRKRTIISSYNYKKRNRILLLSNLLYSFVLWLIYAVMSFVLVGNVMLSLHGLILFINSFIFVICATCISFFIGNLITNKNAVSGIVNVVALGSSFLCGAFVPSEWLPDFVKTIAHVLPTYYYIDTNDKLKAIEEFNFDTLQPLLVNMGIVIGFSILFIILSNVVSKKKRRIG
ncbi:MAG: ABC transporter permease [Clostridia bacterium]|nr:ABC transporter permease [Clostridia bacterium]